VFSAKIENPQPVKIKALVLTFFGKVTCGNTSQAVKIRAVSRKKDVGKLAIYTKESDLNTPDYFTEKATDLKPIACPIMIIYF